MFISTNDFFDINTINTTTDYVELHVHTRYSAKDALCNPKELCRTMKDYGYSAVGISEHGVMYSTIEMAKYCKEFGLKFIPGCEVYETDDRTYYKRDGTQHVYHFLLIAMNQQGYKDLMTIVSDAGTLGKFDDNERTDFDFIERNNLGKNLIASSACLGGRVSKLLYAGQYEEAKTLVLKLNNIFAHFFLELQLNDTKEQNIVNDLLVQLSKETDIPLVITTDVHYIKKEHGDHHDTLICIGFNNKKQDPNRYKYTGDYPYYVRTPQEVYDFLKQKNLPLQAAYNTKLIGDLVNVSIPMGLNLMPDFPTPPGYTSNTYLEKLTYNYLNDYMINNYKSSSHINPEEYLSRLHVELNVITSKGFSGYFLVLWDFVQFLNKENIFLGPGRGSAAGSLVAYLLGITKLDPIKYGLQFERFLNPERASMPDCILVD